MDLVRYYLLGDDTAEPSGLYARLCYAFLVRGCYEETGPLDWPAGSQLR